MNILYTPRTSELSKSRVNIVSHLIGTKMTNVHQTHIIPIGKMVNMHAN